jgi:ABC-type Na+ efflux pump permease subunit
VTALLRKDLRLLGPWAWAIVPGHALFAANAIVSPELFFWANAALAGAFTALLLTIEWKLDAERFVASLPVSRAEVVRARYLGALAAAIVAPALYAVYGRALSALAGARLPRVWRGRAAGWESWEGLLALFLVIALVSFAFLPLHFRLGFGKGSGAFAACAVALAAPGLLWLARDTAAARTGPAEALRAGLVGLAETAGPGLTAATVLALVGGLGTLSLRLSVAFYEKRDL